MQYNAKLDTVELCLTYSCNVNCYNCSSLCDQAPADDLYDMSFYDVENFVNDSLESGYRWKLISIHGGEPTLHKDIIPICNILRDYCDKTGCGIWILSNASTAHIRNSLKRIENDFGIGAGVSYKKEQAQDYVPVNMAPIDNSDEYSIGCKQSECGVCLNYKGYFACSKIAAASRVFGYDAMCSSAAEITQEKCQEQYKKHCGLCGFSAYEQCRTNEKMLSPTWHRAIDTYNRRRFQ